MNNKGADQSVHSHSLISAFVICFLEFCIISKLAISKMSMFQLVSVAESIFVGNSEARFFHIWASMRENKQ